MIQAHKALDTASRICNRKTEQLSFSPNAPTDSDRNDFLDWFKFETSEKLAEKLCESYQVNGQTAWNLLRIAEKFDVRIFTSLAETETD